MAYGSFNAGPGKAPDEDVVRTDQIGIPGGIATLDADGHLTESQRWEVDGYKKAETDQRISAAVDAHNGAENAHSLRHGIFTIGLKNRHIGTVRYTRK